MDVQHLKSRAKRLRPDLPTDEVIDYLVAHFRGDGTVYSPAEVVRSVPGRSSDAVLAALLLLAKKPTNILQPRWFFEAADGSEYELNRKQVADALRDDEFYHPTSGVRIRDFKQAITLVYFATAVLAHALGAPPPPSQRAPSSRAFGARRTKGRRSG